ncbi:MAG TPA: hypothetical protein VJT54_08215 [Verrucomicrobiae bacterium]|nr:hypothetical protein [Verrucomicrobiae bacterium]
MRKSSFDKWLVTLALVAVIAGAVWHFVKSNRAAPEQKQKQIGTESFSFGSEDFHPYYLSSVPRPTKGQPEGDAGFEKLPRAKVEAWLAKHNRDAMSLLTAFRALDDTNYLNEAAVSFPNNSQVELAVLAHDEFPADRRIWLDLFKTSSPSNSLANYLSAQDDFKNGHTEAAVQELLAATGKSQFDTYNTENRLDSENLYSGSGDSPGEAATFAMADMAKEDLPELATFKRLAQGIRDTQQQYLNSGDSGSAANLVQMGMQFGNQIETGDSGKYLINQLVGMAVESIMLQQLNPNTSYDFLGGQTPGQVTQQNKQQKLALHQTISAFDALRPSLTDDEIAGYYDRTKIYGEIEAMKWVIQQHPSSNP